MAKLIRIKRKDGTRSKMLYSDLRMGGKRIRRALSTDKETAEGKLADLVKWRQAERRGDKPDRVPIDLFISRYTSGYLDGKRPATKYRHLAVLKRLAIRHLNEITPESVANLSVQWKSDGYAAGTVNREIKILLAILRKAEEWGYLAPRPWKVEWHKEIKGRPHFFEKNKAEWLLKKFPEPWLTAAVLAWKAGLRCGEISWLTWDDLDFEKRIVKIQPKDGWIPKDFERREIAMSPRLETHLRKRKRVGRFVLGPERIKEQALTDYFRRKIRDWGMKGTLHTFRHTFASHLIMKGVPLPTVAELMGHASINTTMIYTHLTKRHKHEAVAELDT